MDTGDALDELENALRDLIQRILGDGDEEAWLSAAGVSAERLADWKARREREPRRRPGGQTETRLLFYADLKDELELVQRNWKDRFDKCFSNKHQFDVYADRLLAFRNPEAHARALRPFEEHLVLGFTGQLRQEMVVFLSSGGGGPEPEYFSRIEEIRDNFGLRVTGDVTRQGPLHPQSQITLHPGDQVAFVGRAWDPEGQDVIWTVTINFRRQEQLTGNEVEWTWEVRETDIGDPVHVGFQVRGGSRNYVRSGGADDRVTLRYRVLPKPA